MNRYKYYEDKKTAVTDVWLGDHLRLDSFYYKVTGIGRHVDSNIYEFHMTDDAIMTAIDYVFVRRFSLKKLLIDL